MTQEIRKSMERLIEQHRKYAKCEKDPVKKATQEAYTMGVLDMYQRILMEETIQARKGA